jgi:hypothetical protein
MIFEVWKRNRQRQRRRRVWIEKYRWFGLVEFFGVLRFAQDDSRNGQRQQQQQIPDGMTNKETDNGNRNSRSLTG